MLVARAGVCYEAASPLHYICNGNTAICAQTGVIRRQSSSQILFPKRVVRGELIPIIFLAMAAAAASWVPTGDGLRLETAREVAKAHGVPLDVVLRGWYVDAVDGPRGFPGLHAMEDHVVVTNQAADGRHLIKFANYDDFEDACVPAAASAPLQLRLTVVVMPYADLFSCERLQELASDRAMHPRFGYAKIDIANYDILLWKKRGMAALEEEARRYRELGTLMENTVKRLFPGANKRPRPRNGDRRMAQERLMKAHLDAKQYGDAHELLLLMDEAKHDAIFKADGCYDPCSPGDNSSSGESETTAATAELLEEYKQELDETYGVQPLDPYPERSHILRLEAGHKLRRELADARRQVQDIVEHATQEIERIASQLDIMMAEPRLLGCGI